jgi:hypothetical protein
MISKPPKGYGFPQSRGDQKHPNLFVSNHSTIPRHALKIKDEEEDRNSRYRPTVKEGHSPHGENGIEDWHNMNFQSPYISYD